MMMMMMMMMMVMMLMLMELKLLSIKVTSTSLLEDKPRLIYWVTVVSSLVNQPTSARSFQGGESKVENPPIFGMVKKFIQISPNKLNRRASKHLHQELVHWAGTVCVGRGELEITFEELLDAMHASRQ